MKSTDSIITLGNPLLRRRAAPVQDLDTDELQQLIDVLIELTVRANGVGIAAPQVGCQQRLLIIASRPNLRYPYAPTMEPTALINPRMVAHSENQTKDWEGCLSVPNVRGKVPRYQAVEVEYIDRWGRQQRQVYEDFVARIFQHEYDHLEGHVFLDRLESETDLMSEADFNRLILTQGPGTLC
jgi:peptide deformylase